MGKINSDIGDLLEVDQAQVSRDMQNSHLGKLHKDLGEHWNEKGLAETAQRLNLSLTDCFAAVVVMTKIV